MNVGKLIAEARRRAKLEREQKEAETDDFNSLKLAFPTRPALNMDLYRVGFIPSAFYVPDWITEDEETAILRASALCPARHARLLLPLPPPSLSSPLLLPSLSYLYPSPFFLLTLFLTLFLLLFFE